MRKSENVGHREQQLVLESLEREHANLDKMVAKNVKAPGCDETSLTSLKLRKLELKDNISNLRNQLA